MKIRFPLLVLTALFFNTSFAHVSEQEFNELKAEVKKLKEQAAKHTAVANIDSYIRNSTCDALTNQPTNACSDVVGSYCYSVAEFNAANGDSLAGYTFTATKTTADYFNMDGGVWLCDNKIIRTPLINQCTKIGGNAHTRAAKAVEFTIPYGTITTPYIVAAYKNLAGGINGSSEMTSFALCKQNATDTAYITP